MKKLILILVIIFQLTSCSSPKTEVTVSLPILSTTAISNITETDATSGGTISSNGGDNIITKGIVWNTNPNPTINLTTKTIDGSGNNNFTSTLFGLNKGTTYYVRAYAINSAGTSYGNEITFTSQDISTGLVASYNYNGNANDSSGNNYNGYGYDGTGAGWSSDRFGNQNSASNSTTNYPTSICSKFNTSLNNSLFSICFWVKHSYTTSPIQDNSLWFKGEGGSWTLSGINLNSSGKIQMYYQTGKNYSINSLSANNWNFIVFTINQNSLKIYINGNLDSSQNFYGFNWSTTNKTGIKTKHNFSGSIDDLKFYNICLNQEQINYLYKN